MKEKENENNKKPSLEELFDRLGKVAGDLEKEGVSLEDSFDLYKKGMELLKQCNDTIDKVEKKVQALGENGESHEF